MTEKLGAAGMGEVYRATDTKLGRDRARGKFRVRCFGRSGGCVSQIDCATMATDVPLGQAPMKTLTIRQMRIALSRLDDVVAKEGEILVTRRGRALARVVPVRRPQTAPSHAALRAKMRRLTVPSEVLIRRDRDSR